jgi:hypothetical protein
VGSTSVGGANDEGGTVGCCTIGGCTGGAWTGGICTGGIGAAGAEGVYTS